MYIVSPYTSARFALSYHGRAPCCAAPDQAMWQKRSRSLELGNICAEHHPKALIVKNVEHIQGAPRRCRYNLMLVGSLQP